MKFTDLTSQQRSMLAMLCTGQTFNTAELGRGYTPKLTPDLAATYLLGMRDLGLVYSNQKPTGVQYAAWRASQYGKDVFNGRPADVPASIPTVSTIGQYVFVVYRAGLIGGNGYVSQHTLEDAALAEAGRLADELKKEFCVAKLFARVKPVVQPTHVIERV